ncbi:MAG: WbqC family protein [Limnobacter sp.]|nr:WbqC family protein [Limnobacter sp.]
MKLGIMQPYFFPYLGHFALIAHTDQWVVFDITQYTPKTYMSRNEVLKQNGGRQRIFAELNNASIHIKTHAATLANPTKTHKQLLGSLSHYKKHAPHYFEVVRIVNETFESLAKSRQPQSLVQLNQTGLQAVCSYLNLPFHAVKASELKLNIPDSMLPGQWAPLICKHLQATGYINPIGGKGLFNRKDFDEAGVQAEFLELPALLYETGAYPFEPNLSVLDVLMWCTPETIKEHLLTQAKTQSL